MNQSQLPVSIAGAVPAVYTTWAATLSPIWWSLCNYHAVIGHRRPLSAAFAYAAPNPGSGGFTCHTGICRRRCAQRSRPSSAPLCIARRLLDCGHALTLHVGGVKNVAGVRKTTNVPSLYRGFAPYFPSPRVSICFFLFSPTTPARHCASSLFGHGQRSVPGGLVTFVLLRGAVLPVPGQRWPLPGRYRLWLTTAVCPTVLSRYLLTLAPWAAVLLSRPAVPL